jgi:ADP-ribosyl-[dinitrogen reductase] hydrolase
MAIVIAEVASTGTDLRAAAALDAITARFVAWMDEATDVGTQTSRVLSAVRAVPTAASATAVAEELFRRTGKTGNGSLMRTAPVALAYLRDPTGLVEAAHAVSALTHGNRQAGECCALWCLAIRHAVLHGSFDGLHAAIFGLPSERAAVWAARLRRAESSSRTRSSTTDGWSPP